MPSMQANEGPSRVETQSRVVTLESALAAAQADLAAARRETQEATAAAARMLAHADAERDAAVRERDQQERFKWRANERADAAEGRERGLREALEGVVKDIEDFTGTGYGSLHPNDFKILDLRAALAAASPAAGRAEALAGEELAQAKQDAEDNYEQGIGRGLRAAEEAARRHRLGDKYENDVPPRMMREEIVNAIRVIDAKALAATPAVAPPPPGPTGGAGTTVRQGTQDGGTGYECGKCKRRRVIPRAIVDVTRCECGAEPGYWCGSFAEDPATPPAAKGGSDAVR